MKRSTNIIISEDLKGTFGDTRYRVITQRYIQVIYIVPLGGTYMVGIE